MSWSDADYAEAKRLWAAGESAATIAAALGKSRGAVIGKAHRNRTDFPERANVAPPKSRRRKGGGSAAGPKPSRATTSRARGRPFAPGAGGGGRPDDPSGAVKPTRSRRTSDRNAKRPFPLRDDGLPLRAAPVAFEDVPAGRCRWPVDLRLDAPCGPAMVVCGAPVSHAGSQRSMARTHCPMHLAKAGQSPVRRGG